MIIIYIALSIILFIILIVNTYYVKVNVINISKSIKKEKVKVVHISDLHGQRYYINGRLSSILNRIKPDYLVITGDLTTKQSQLIKILNEINSIEVSGKVFLILGNYEREELIIFKKRKIDIIEILRQSEHKKLRFLINEAEVVSARDDKFLFFGLDNSSYDGLDNINFETRNYLKGLEKEKIDFRILMAHSPNIINFINKNNISYDLVLAGHTHGNQINIPLIKKYKNRYAHFHVGMKNDRGRYFYISRGLGTVKLPIRINSSPEITVFEI